MGDGAGLPPLAELAGRIASGETTSEQVTTECLDRIAALDGDVGAWAHVDREAALAQARACDAEPARGPVHGIPIGVKDVIDTAGMPTQRGTPVHAGRVPVEDAHCVAQLRRSGAVIVGKTETCEYATWTPARTKNPHNPAHTPGGSSAGSAAAVGADMVPLALGTQTVGSTIRPAAFCGVVGMKPTFGLLPMGGVLSTSQRLDTLGLFALSPEDMALLFRALAPAGLATGETAASVLAVESPWWDRADAVSHLAFGTAASALGDAGLDVSEGALPGGSHALPEMQDLVAHFDISNNLRQYFLDHEALFSDDMSPRMVRGLAISTSDYWDAVRGIDAMRPAVQRLLAGGRVMLMPATTGVAPEGLGSTGDATFVRSWSSLGNPVVTVPVIVDAPTGLPVGVQLIGGHGEDLRVLEVARVLVQELGSPSVIRRHLRCGSVSGSRS